MTVPEIEPQWVHQRDHVGTESTSVHCGPCAPALENAGGGTEFKETDLGDLPRTHLPLLFYTFPLGIP